MFVAPIGTFLLGTILGFIKGFQRPKFSAKAAGVWIVVIAAPALYLLITGGDPAILVILIIGLALTYLSLVIGTLIGGWIAHLTGRRAS